MSGVLQRTIVMKLSQFVSFINKQALKQKRESCYWDGKSPSWYNSSEDSSEKLAPGYINAVGIWWILYSKHVSSMLESPIGHWNLNHAWTFLGMVLLADRDMEPLTDMNTVDCAGFFVALPKQRNKKLLAYRPGELRVQWAISTTVNNRK